MRARPGLVQAFRGSEAGGCGEDLLLPPVPLALEARVPSSRLDARIVMVRMWWGSARFNSSFCRVRAWEDESRAPDCGISRVRQKSAAVTGTWEGVRKALRRHSDSSGPRAARTQASAPPGQAGLKAPHGRRGFVEGWKRVWGSVMLCPKYWECCSRKRWGDQKLIVLAERLKSV